MLIFEINQRDGWSVDVPRGAYSEPYWKLICCDIAAGIARVNDATVDRITP